MSKKRILIVENLYGEFKSIKRRLGELFDDEVEIFPRDVSGNDYHNHDELIDAFKDGPEKFQDILNFYGQIDLYILDISLDGEQDNLGIEFFKFLQEEAEFEVKAIFISQTPKSSLPLPDDGSFHFISKSDYGRQFPNQVAFKVRAVCDIQFGQPNERGQRLGARTRDLIEGKEGGEPAPKGFINWLRRGIKTIRVLGLTWAIVGAVQIGNDFLKIAVLDVVIRLAFYALIFFTTLSSLINIFGAILVSLPYSIAGPVRTLEPVQKWMVFLTGAKEPAPAMLPLLTAESIFLNMLPIFIVFGFFNYYETNVREYFLQGNLQKISDEISTKPMNVSKILFISSMISYLFIKIIELISELKPGHSASSLAQPAEAANHFAVPVDLISYGVVLLILMGYFAYLDRKHPSNPADAVVSKK
jgi:hypothetical protein